jgi:hypothetical protein
MNMLYTVLPQRSPCVLHGFPQIFTNERAISIIKQWILSLIKEDKTCYEYKRKNGERLIVSYSDNRAKKDAYNRVRGIVRLRKTYKAAITQNNFIYLIKLFKCKIIVILNIMKR